ncbi:MAG: CapA family protein [Bacteroidales bacterium]|nr:CapA family protein [Bacteroidales bacterium]
MRLKTIILALSLFLSASIACGQQGNGYLRLVFAGDLMGHVPLHNAARQSDGSYDYSPYFQYIKDYIQSVDLAVVNLEVTLAGKPYTGYPCFSAPDAIAAAAQDAGFDIFVTANNHCMDKGRRGLERTIGVLDSLGVAHLGTYRTAQERYKDHPLIVERNGIRLALLNYTYGTNGISVREPNVVNMIDTAMMLRDLQTARLKKVDFVIAVVHWGVEYQKHNNKEQERIARWLFDNGCNAVIGAHPHVVQNMTIDVNPDNERYPELVVYSMGNFLSNQHDPGCDGGILFELDLYKRGAVTNIYSCAYMPFYVHKAVVDGRRQYHIVPTSDALAYPDSYGISSSALQLIRRFDDNIRRLMAEEPPTAHNYRIPECRFYDNQKPLPQCLYADCYQTFGYPLSGRPLSLPIWRRGWSQGVFPLGNCTK